MIPRAFLVFFGIFAAMAAMAGATAIMVQQKPVWRYSVVGGPFQMNDLTGKLVTQQDLVGKPSVFYFGFTYCPEICPATLFKLSNALRELGPAADRMNYVFVTLDPARDTPSELKAYLDSFDPRIRALIGTPSQIADMTERYRVVSRRVETSPGDYTIEHTASLMLFDRTGRMVGGVDHDEPASALVEKLRSLASPGTCRPNAPGSLWEASVIKGSQGGRCG